MRFFQSSITAAIVSELHILAPELKVNGLRSYRTDGPETLRLLESGFVQTEDHILDSGVWGLTQGTLKHKSNVKIYGKSLKRIGNRFRFYMNFDEIFMDEGSEEFDDRAIATNLKNQKYLESQGLNPVPVIHSLDDDEIDYYIGMKQAKVQKERKVLTDAVDKLYAAGYKVHIFRVGSYKNLTGLKAWPCDASFFAQWASCGRVIFLSGQPTKAKEITFSFLSHDESGDPVDDFIDDHKEGDLILAEYQAEILEPLSLNIETLYSDPFSRMLANCYYYCQLEKILTEEQVNAGVKFDER